MRKHNNISLNRLQQYTEYMHSRNTIITKLKMIGYRTEISAEHKLNQCQGLCFAISAIIDIHARFEWREGVLIQ